MPGFIGHLYLTIAIKNVGGGMMKQTTTHRAELQEWMKITSQATLVPIVLYIKSSIPGGGPSHWFIFDMPEWNLIWNYIDLDIRTPGRREEGPAIENES